MTIGLSNQFSVFLRVIVLHRFYCIGKKCRMCRVPTQPGKRENGKSPGIRYWSFTAIKSPGISTCGDFSRELSGKICSLAHPQRHSYACMLNLVYQLFFARKRLNCSLTTAFVINERRDKYWGVFIGTGQ